jgi:RNA 3'-terminal phosphate cyclase (ATP)
VLQTVLPALFTAAEPSTLVLEGGTHNPASPPFDFLVRSFLPLVKRMGPQVEATLDRPGFYPAGGGRLRVRVTPSPRLQPLELEERGAITGRSVRSLLSNLPRSIGERELVRLRERLGWDARVFSIESVDSAGPGNVVLVDVECEHLTEVFVGFGEKGVRAEAVADRAADEVTAYLATDVPVGPHLADQLVLPLALAGGGRFRTVAPTAHTRTQLAVVQRFLGTTLQLTPDGGAWRFRVG